MTEFKVPYRAKKQRLIYTELTPEQKAAWRRDADEPTWGKLTPEQLELWPKDLEEYNKPMKDNPSPKNAQDFIDVASNTLWARGKDYDQPTGERSAGKVAVAFNAIAGKDLAEAHIWLILQLVKDVRQFTGKYHEDSAIDCIAYSALKAEALVREA
jgi:hypothetical protein